MSATMLKVGLRGLPLWLTRSRAGYLCIANVRLYRLALMRLAPNDDVTAFVFDRRPKRDALRLAYAIELFVLPMLFSLTRADTKRLRQVWRRLVQDSALREHFPGDWIAAVAGEFSNDDPETTP